MNIFLWIIQVMLALHTIMGALWKFSNSEQTASLSSIPHALWLLMGVMELMASLALIIPAFRKRFGMMAPLAASFIVAEMIFFCIVHLYAGDGQNFQFIYWLVVAAICSLFAYARFVIKPIS